MELETAIGYLVALAVPLWLVIEQAMCWRKSAKQAQKEVEPGRPQASPLPAQPLKPHALPQ
jgi:hypothetical protein